MGRVRVEGVAQTRRAVLPVLCIAVLSVFSPTLPSGAAEPTGPEQLTSAALDKVRADPLALRDFLKRSRRVPISTAI
jgi:hypothetical protein